MRDGRELAKFLRDRHCRNLDVFFRWRSIGASSSPRVVSSSSFPCRACLAVVRRPHRHTAKAADCCAAQRWVGRPQVQQQQRERRQTAVHPRWLPCSPPSAVAIGDQAPRPAAEIPEADRLQAVAAVPPRRIRTGRGFLSWRERAGRRTLRRRSDAGGTHVRWRLLRARWHRSCPPRCPPGCCSPDATSDRSEVHRCCRVASGIVARLLLPGYVAHIAVTSLILSHSV